MVCASHVDWPRNTTLSGGAVVAQTSLAEILLRLNAGLVGIIASLASGGKHEKLELDYRSLTDLSEQSRHETIGVLRRLYRRMDSSRLPSTLDRTRPPALSEAKGARKLPHSVPSRHTKIRGPTVARITIEDSSKPAKLAVVEPGSMKKKLSSASTSTLSRARSASSTAVNTLSSSPPSSYQKSSRPMHQRSNTAPELPEQRRRPSAAPTTAPPLPAHPSALRPIHSAPKLSTPREETLEPRPPVPQTAQPTVAAETHDRRDARRRKHTPTHYSIESASTKLGEIPMHKWAAPSDFDAMSVLNRQAERDGRPAAAHAEGGVTDVRRKRFGLLWLFGRKGVAS